MCEQIDNVYKCGHRGFRRYEYCKQLGITCLGAGGTHKEHPVEDICTDCEQRNEIKAATPASHARKDPWGADDPYKKKKKT